MGAKGHLHVTFNNNSKRDFYICLANHISFKMIWNVQLIFYISVRNHRHDHDILSSAIVWCNNAFFFVICILNESTPCRNLIVIW